MTIKNKFIVLVALSVISIAVLIVLGQYSIGAMVELEENEVGIERLAGAFHKARVAERTFLLTTGSGEGSSVDKALQGVNGHREDLQSSFREAGLEAPLLQSLGRGLEEYRHTFQRVVRGLQPNDAEGLRRAMDELDRVAAGIERTLAALDKDMGSAIDAESAATNGLMLGVSLVMLLGMAGVLAWFARSILDPLQSLRNVIEDAASRRDLTLRSDVAGDDEVSNIARSFNAMMDEFQAVLTRVVESSNRLSTLSAQTAGVTEATSQGVQRQQAESDQVATAMNEMTATVQEVARHAADAAGASNVADDEAGKGKQVVMQATDGIRQLVSEVEKTANVIQELEQESMNIDTVLTVITSIAEQTNLLALNAAIEAARAGESGRGFAVVADEVRTLAQRSQESTEEIKSIIERLQTRAQGAVKAMETGRNQAQATVAQAETASQSLVAIGDAVAAIKDMNTQIASAAEEQSAVAEEINQSVVNIAQVSLETANGADQTLQAASQMAGLSAELQERVGVFRLGEGGSALDLSKAKAAHLAWKTRLRDFLDGRGTLTLDEAVSHKDCVLGKWYYGEGLAHFGHLHEMHELEEPHAEMHGLIREIIEAKQRGDLAEAERLFRQIEPLSKEIVAMLTMVESKSVS